MATRKRTLEKVDTTNRISKHLKNGDGDGKAAKGTVQTLKIAPLRQEVIAFRIQGLTPFVQNAFSQKAREMMRKRQEQGSQGDKNRKKEPKNFQQCYEDAKHVSTDGWVGIPAISFRAAMISACRLCGFKMTHSKQSVFINADGYDRVDATPLVKITKGEPHYVEHAVRNESGVADIRPRPMWDPGWEAIVRVRFDVETFSAQDVANLLNRAGHQVGVGEGRPDSKNSVGQGWGEFKVVEIVNN